MDRFSLALSLAEAASVYLLEHASLSRTSSSKGENDYVTEADKNVERMIISGIREQFPEDDVFGEESGESGKSENRWIIDPIDGTVDFMNSFPCYTISIAYEEKGCLKFGIVKCPPLGETFYAKSGEGAYLNGKRIKVQSGIPLRKSLAIMVPPHRHPELLRSYFEKMYDLYSVFTDQRSLGSAAISLCFVASGRVALYYETMLEEYDVAAGILIAREAGAIVDVTRSGHHIKSIVCGTEEAVKGLYGKIGNKTDLF